MLFLLEVGSKAAPGLNGRYEKTWKKAVTFVQELQTKVVNSGGFSRITGGFMQLILEDS